MFVETTMNVMWTDLVLDKRPEALNMSKFENESHFSL